MFKKRVLVLNILYNRFDSADKARASSRGNTCGASLERKDSAGSASKRNGELFT